MTHSLISVTWRQRVGVGVATAVLALVVLMLGTRLAPATQVSANAISASVATTNVIRTTLLDTRTETGTLGFGDPVDVPFISRARTGIVTWMAPEGTVVSRGEPLYAIDGQPVILLYGEWPLFRSLRFEEESFETYEWLELMNAQDDERQAALRLALQRARLAETEARLEEARLHQEDSTREQPVTPQFIRLTESVAAARQRLQRIERLGQSDFVSDEDIQRTRYELAVTEAELDAAMRERTQQVAAGTTAVADARLQVVEAERALRDASDTLDALRSMENENADIALLRDNLSSLGFDGPAADTIRKWQAAAGRSATGLIEPGQIVVSEGPVRVADHMVDVGDIVFGGRDGQSGVSRESNSSDLVMRYTDTQRSVTVPLAITDHAYARPGDPVVVTLPDNAEIEGVIREVSSNFDAQGLADTIIDIPDQTQLGALMAASVEVEFVIGRRDDVLAVPIAALLALPDGGFGLEVIEGASSHIVPVQTGLFARGSVEVSGEQIAAGVEVGVPR